MKNSISSRLFRLVCTISCLIMVVSSAPKFPAQAAIFKETAPYFSPASCMFKLPTGWEEGKQVDCGYLTVPEQYENPDGPTIQLAVAILRSQDPNKRSDPLVMLQGGPGGSTIDTYTQILPTSNRLPGNRDVILFDQRGTLYSKPALTCPELMDLTLSTLDQDLTPEESNQLSLEALKKCRNRLVEEGVNLHAYDSLENAADVESLRQALGYELINLYGVSYGTLLALHVMRDFPQGLRSIIIDSVVPPQVNFILGAPQAENRAFETLFAACAADPGCNSSYPHLRDVFYELVDQLNAKPVEIKVSDSLDGKSYPALFDGDALLSTIFQMMYNSEFIPLLPRIIYNIRAGDYAFVERILSIIVFDRTMSYGMYYSVICAEDADFTTSEYDLSGLPSQIYEYEKDSAQYILDACKLWNVEELNAIVDKPVQSDIPSLVLAGVFDPITPPDYARQAAQGLSNSFFFLFPAGSHGQVGSSECADNILLQFLDNPTRSPDASCIEKDGGVKFSTRESLVPLPVLANLLNLQGETGGQLLLYVLSLFFLLTAFLVYPVAWLVGLMREKPQPVASPYQYQPVGPEMAYRPLDSGNHSPKQSLFYRYAPWFACLAAGSLFLFTVVLAVAIFKLVLSNDISILLGLPGSMRPLFLLPLLALLFIVGMFCGTISAWRHGLGKALGRIYLTLLTLAALVCVVILMLWGMLGASFL